ncbi:MAG: Fe-S-binding domain-containing protein, partial [Nitrospinota bacterium]|nr:Fe-S-binding domain-containing protein [Nitrospinota bacterium]
MENYLLTLITFIPLAGAVIVMLFFEKGQTKAIKGFATAVTIVDFLLSIPLWTQFDTSEAGFQFVQKVSWIPTIGVSYFVGVDGISVLLVLLTTITMIVSTVCSFSAIVDREKEYYVCLLLMSTG